MLNDNSIFYDPEHMEYVDQSAEMIEDHLGYLKVLRDWFREIGQRLPLSCCTNYRDSWFHYKKVYERMDHISVIQEGYTLEEHLIRAVKDAIISYFKFYIYKIEFIYLQSKNGHLLSDTERCHVKKDYPAARSISINEAGWERDLYGRLEKERKESSFPLVALYVYEQQSDLKNVARRLQKCMHSVKNYCDQLRLDGTDIYRPVDSDEYIERCQMVYTEMIDHLEDLHMKNMVFIFAQQIQKTHPACPLK